MNRQDIVTSEFAKLVPERLQRWLERALKV